MSFTQAVISGLRGFCYFGGRSSRSEYLWWMLLVNILSIPFIAIDISNGLFEGNPPLACFLFEIAMFVPNLAITARRLHDLDLPIWQTFIPVINIYLLIPLVFIKGDEEDNRYGPNPLKPKTVNNAVVQESENSFPIGEHPA